MNDSTPTIPPIVRTVAYFALLGLGALVLGVEGFAAIWADPELADKLSRSGGVLLSVAALIGGGLGVTYRPTRNVPQAGVQGGEGL